MDLGEALERTTNYTSRAARRKTGDAVIRRCLGPEGLTRQSGINTLQVPTPFERLLDRPRKEDSP
jgi:hypothetical protein